jgi:integrase
MAKRGRNGEPWWRKDRRCYYAWVRGTLTRLDPDKERAWALWHSLCAAPIYSPSLSIDLVEAVKKYIEGPLSSAYKLSTVRVRAPYLRLFAREHKGLVSGPLIREYMDGRKTLGVSGKYTLACALSPFLQWCSEQQFIAWGPEDEKCMRVKRPPSRGIDTVIEPKYDAVVMSRAPAEIRSALTFLRATGCRPSELCALEAKYVAEDGRSAVLLEHKTDDTNRARVIVVPETSVSMLLELKQKRPYGPLFWWDGSPLTSRRLTNWVYNTKRYYKEEIPPNIILYGYRHTFATDALAAGVSDALVAQLLGHSGTATLHHHYSHLTSRMDALKEAIGKVR